MNKIDILKQNGFEEDRGHGAYTGHGVYYNKKYKIIFSDEAIQSYDKDTLLQMIEEGKKHPDWSFYFRKPITDEKKKEIIDDIIN